MANPSLIDATVIYGNTASFLASTTTTNVVSNASGTNSIYKINSLVAANINTVSASITLEFNNGGSNNFIARSMVVPAYTTLVIIGKDTGLYLKENCSLQVTASANVCVVTTTSWEEIT